jgi:hypothetical protein
LQLLEADDQARGTPDIIHAARKLAVKEARQVIELQNAPAPAIREHPIKCSPDACREIRLLETEVSFITRKRFTIVLPGGADQDMPGNARFAERVGYGRSKQKVVLIFRLMRRTKGQSAIVAAEIRQNSKVLVQIKGNRGCITVNQLLEFPGVNDCNVIVQE